MENQSKGRRKLNRDGFLDGFSPVSTTRIEWKSRKRSASGRNIDKLTEDTANETPNKQEETPSPAEKKIEDSNTVIPPELSERRKALFEPLEPINNVNGGRPSNESLLPPPDFESATYPRGWLIGKKRKLVNVDVVESMRRIAVQEMNRKDREIDELNEVLDEDGKVLEQLQQEVLEEKCKRTTLERENATLKDQIKLLVEMLHEGEGEREGEEDEPVGDEDPNEGP